MIKKPTVDKVTKYNPKFHGSQSRAGNGHCGWHGVSCQRPPIISFVEVRQNGDRYRQSGCERVVEDLGITAP